MDQAAGAAAAQFAPEYCEGTKAALKSSEAKEGCDRKREKKPRTAETEAKREKEEAEAEEAEEEERNRKADDKKNIVRCSQS